jgi:2'-5' RNA ligase
MEYLRLFFAIDIPFSLKEKIERKLKEIALPINAKLTPKENYHLTLLFLGNVKIDDLTKVIEAGEKTFKNCEPTELYGTHISVAPNQNFGRMLWLNFDFNDKLADLKKKLEENLRAAGVNFKLEERELKIHLTLARFEPQRMAFKDIDFPIHFKMTDIYLMESKLQKPNAVYIPLKRYLLSEIAKK